MRQVCATQSGRGGQGRCGQGQGKGQGQGGQGGGRCGQGQGRGLGQAGRAGNMADNAGSLQTGPGLCVCPQCGQTAPHTPGVACTTMHCPACGAAMARQ